MNAGSSAITVATVVIQPGNVQTVAGDGTYGHRDGVPALQAEFADPDGVAVDSVGNIYICDLENQGIRLVNNTTGLIITIAGSSGIYGYNGDNIPATAAEISYARDVSVDTAGNVYFSDQPNQRVREIVVSTRTSSFTSSNNTAFVVGTPASFVVTTSYWPTPSLTLSGTLPNGITFTDNGNGTGTLSGTPALGANGTFHLTSTASDTVFPNVLQALTLTVYPAGGSPAASSATLLGIDSQTSGNSQGVYGIDGYSLANSYQNIPVYASFAIQNQLSYTWIYGTSDQRALLLPNSSTRIAATWYDNPGVSYTNSDFIFNVSLTDGKPHLLELYILDFDYRGRVETVEVQDASSGFPLYTVPLSNFTNGVYLVWNITGSVNIVATGVSGPNSVVSGVFFGGGANTSSPPTISQQPQNASVYVGASGIFTVGASGGSLNYQWLSQPPGASSFTPIAGATSPSYMTPPTTLGNNGTQFECAITNALGTVTSNLVTLTVALSPPVIAQQPQNSGVFGGQSATFSVVATGSNLPISGNGHRRGVLYFLPSLGRQRVVTQLRRR